ncbi:MAG: acetyl-CoA carboxylase biotin carboxyl carrier protein [Candidatus Sericytochromatia bacterium]|nr:acetyl-CoA carboxylase biotin carboxyl carrier protein [Candidatus Sericytochromatia bacterium]
MPDSIDPCALPMAEVKELLAAFDASEAAELSLSQGGFKLKLRKPTAFDRLASSPVASFVPAQAAVNAPVVEPPSPVGTLQAGPSPTVSYVKSPMVGTFYRAPAPESPPFVEVGDRVTAGQTVCIIEAMKLMNEIEAEQTGRVVRILLQNGDSVEYGQAMLEIQPDLA